MHIEEAGKQIVDAAIKVHSQLGPGLLEFVYEVALAHELGKRGLSVENRYPSPLNMMESSFRKDSVQI